MIKIVNIAVLILSLSVNCLAQLSVPDSLQKTVYFLASDSLLGRSPGSAESEKAIEFIIKAMQNADIKPFVANYRMPVYWYANRNATGTNVVGVIEGCDPVLKNEYIVLGAHFDHIGANLSDPKNPIIYNGADDNASGVATIIEVGRQLAANKGKLKRSVLIIAFDAEEQGLIGSKYFVEHCPVDINQIKYMMSIDMVGALNKGGAGKFNGAASMKDGVKFLESLAQTDSLPTEYIKHSAFWYARTDVKHFYLNKIPGMYVSTGLKSPYHKPEDDANLIDYQGMTKMTNQIYNVTVGVANKENIQFKNTEPAFKVGFCLNFGSNHFLPTEGSLTYKNSFVYSAGLTTQTRLNKYYNLQADVLYKNKGSRTDMGKAQFNCVEVPVYLQIITPNDMVRSYAIVGGYYSYAFDGKIGSKTISWNSTDLKRNDYGLVYGFGFMIYQYQIGFKGNIGLGKMSDNESFMPQSKYRSAELTLGYFF
jgi:hypothetical protein